MEDDSLSPEGNYIIQFDRFEVRMSHWVEVPHILRVVDDFLLFDLRGDVWSAGQIRWLSDSSVEMTVRKYPGWVSCELFLDLQADRGEGTSGSDRFAGNLFGLENWVRRH